MTRRPRVRELLSPLLLGGASILLVGCDANGHEARGPAAAVSGAQDQIASPSLLQQQLAMNAESWRKIQAAGLKDPPILALDFSYVSPSRQSARKLVKLLQEQTDYEVGEPQEQRAFGDVVWTISGRTQPAELSRQTLDDWVTWMVTAGLTAGCLFDGWGAELPSS